MQDTKANSYYNYSAKILYEVPQDTSFNFFLVPNHDDIDNYTDALYSCRCSKGNPWWNSKGISKYIPVVLWPLSKILYRQMLSPNNLKATSK